MSITLKYLTKVTGTKQVSHFVQSISSGKFRQYDYNEHNQDYYNNSSPPDYLLERISAAFYLYHASEDFLTSEIVRPFLKLFV